MKSILMTTSAVLLVTGFATGQARAQATCPEDIDAFTRAYEEALANDELGAALSAGEQAELFGLRTAAENLYAAGDADTCAEVIERANLLLETAIAPQIVTPSELIGREVVNAQDENLGEIEDVMLDPLSGRIAYVVIEHGGFLGIGDDLFAVPWRVMQFVPGNDQTLLLDIQEERLENAPRFSREDASPLERREFVTAVHSYYGVEPYWQDGLDYTALGLGGAGAAGAGAAGVVETPPALEEAPEEPELEAPEVKQAPQAEAEAPAVVAEAPEAETEAPQAEQAVPEAPAGEPAAGTELSMVMERLGQLESEVQALSEGGLGGNIEQSISELEERIAALAEQGPGEQVTQAISDLESKVQQLAERAPDVDIKQALRQLEERVQALSEGGVGQQVTDAIARLEEQVQALAERGLGGDETGLQAVPGAGEGEQPAAIVVVPDQDAQADEQAGEQQTERQAGEQQPTEQPAEAAEQAPTDQQAGDAQGVLIPAVPAGQAGTAAPEIEEEVVIQGRTVEPRPAEGIETLAGQSCEEQIAMLQEDLERAEQLGVAIDDAESELEEAQAMLNNNSEALCRAAIKRAHEELVAVGFEPSEVN